MTTEREYQEGQRRIKKQRQKNSNQPLWIFMGIIIFLSLIFFQNSQNTSPVSNTSTSKNIDR